MNSTVDLYLRFCKNQIDETLAKQVAVYFQLNGTPPRNYHAKIEPMNDDTFSEKIGINGFIQCPVKYILILSYILVTYYKFLYSRSPNFTPLDFFCEYNKKIRCIIQHQLLVKIFSIN